MVLPSAAGGGRDHVSVPYYDLVLLADSVGPDFLQPGETCRLRIEEQQRFFYNHCVC